MGKIERQVLAILEGEPDNAFTTEDLCERVYGRPVEKKHRVSMLRVMRAVTESDPRYEVIKAEYRGAESILFDGTRVLSRAMAWGKGDNLNGYRGKGYGWGAEAEFTRARWGATEDTIRAKLPASWTTEDGSCWLACEIKKAELSGDTERAATLKAKADARRARAMASFKSEPPAEDLARQAERTAPAPVESEALRRKLADALEEVSRLNRENDRLTVENDSLKRRLKAKEARESDLCKRLDAATAERDQARAAKVRADADLALSRH